ncbi:hypothetical protein COOONC_27755 [Cooperia oncophora]
MGYLLCGGLCLLLFTGVAPAESMRYQAVQKRFDIDIAKRTELSDSESLQEYPVVTGGPKDETATEKHVLNYSSSPSRFDPVRGFSFYKKRFDPYKKRFDPYVKRFDPFSKRFDPYEKRFDPLSKRFDPYLKRFDGSYGITDEMDPLDKRFDPYSKRFDVSDLYDTYSKRFDVYKRFPSSKRFEPFKRFEPYSKRFDIFKRFDPFPYASALTDIDAYEIYPDVPKRYEPTYSKEYWGQLNTKRNIIDPYAFHVGFGR